jgi:Tol biopolymer transport system component
MEVTAVAFRKGFSVLAAVALAAVFALDGSAAPSSRAVPRASRPAVAAVVNGKRGPTVGLISYDGSHWQVLSRLGLRDGARAISWEPGGNLLALTTAGGTDSNELHVLDLTRKTERVLTRSRQGDPAAFFETLAWSPSGRWIAVTRSPGLYGAEIEVINAASGSIARRFRKNARLDSALSWSADEKSIYFTQQREGNAPLLRRLVRASGNVVPVPGPHGLDPAIRRDGTLAVTVRLGIAIVRKGRSRRLAGSTIGDRFPQWSHDGSLLFVERPSADCPRFGNPAICSHVVALPLRRRTTSALPRLARNPATR